jgi:very-short-patch-repair endonuclease
MNNHYNPRLTKYAHELRHESVSIAEKYLWKNGLSRSKCGAKFKRQRPIDSFIVDFFAPEIGLIMEVDGSSHFSKNEYDRYRQNKLESFGYTFLRIYEGEVMQNFGDVLTQIQHAVYCLNEQKGSI